MRLGWTLRLCLALGLTALGAGLAAATATWTPTVTPTPTPTATISPTFTVSTTFTITPTSTISPTFTVSPTISPSFTVSPTAPPSSTATATASPTASPLPSTATVSPSPPLTPTVTATASPTATPNIAATDIAATQTALAPPVPGGGQAYVYPDPIPPGTDAHLVFPAGLSASATVRVFNAAGEAAAKVEAGPVSRGQLLLPTARFAPGVYLYLLELSYGTGPPTAFPVGHFVMGRR